MQHFVTIAILTFISWGMAEPPVSQYLPPNQGYQTPSNSYGPPQRGSGGSGGSFGGGIGGGIGSGIGGGISGGIGRTPSTSYGTPAVTSAIFPKQGGRGGQGGRGIGGYGGGAGGDEGSYGPAKYEFKYDVQDFESGNDFGHMESRDGDLTVGRYYVLLPDGRKQIVDYEADYNGYRPMVRYEEVGGGRGGGGGFAGIGGASRGGYAGGGGSGGGGYDSNAQQIKGSFGGYQ